MAEDDDGPSGRGPVGQQELKERADAFQQRRRLFAQASERRLADLDADERAERKEQERRKKREAVIAAEGGGGGLGGRGLACLASRDSGAAGQEAPGVDRAPQTPQYFEMAGVLQSFRHALALHAAHPDTALAATGGAQGQISVWSQSRDASSSKDPDGAHTAVRPVAACGEQPWQLVEKISSSRPSAKEMVMALTFIPCPSYLRAGDPAEPEIFLAAASSNKTIKIWSGPAAPVSSGNAPVAHPARGEASGGTSSASADHSMADPDARGAPASSDADGTGGEGAGEAAEPGGQRQARVRLTLVPLSSGLAGEESQQLADDKDISDLLSREIATALAVHHTRVRAEVRESNNKGCTIDVHLTKASSQRGALAELDELHRHYKGPSNTDLSVDELAAKAQDRQQRGDIGDIENRPAAVRHEAARGRQGPYNDERYDTELLAALLSSASDMHSKLRATGHAQKIRKARIVFVQGGAPADGASGGGGGGAAAAAGSGGGGAAAAGAMLTDNQDAASDAHGAADRDATGRRREPTAGGDTRDEARWRLRACLVDDATAACALQGLAHTDEVACLVCRHGEPAQPLLVSAGGDMLVKLWSVLPVAAARRPDAAGDGADAAAAGEAASKPPPPDSSAGGGAAAIAGAAASSQGVTQGELLRVDGGGSQDGAGFTAKAGGQEAVGAALLGLRAGKWQCAGVLRGHTARIISVAIGGCRGRLIVSSDSSGEMLVWGDGGVMRQRVRADPALRAWAPASSAGAALAHDTRAGAALAHAVADPLVPTSQSASGGRVSSSTGSSKAHADEGQICGVRDVEFVLMDRIEETWPVRCVTLSTRRPLAENLLVLRELAPSAWPEDEDDQREMVLEEQLQALEATLQQATQDLAECVAASGVLKLLAADAARRSKEPALTDRAVLRQWVREQALVADNEIAPLLKELDARRIQSLPSLRALVAGDGNGNALARLVKPLKQTPAIAAATLRKLATALAHLEAHAALHAAEAERSARKVVTAMGDDAPPRVRQGWQQAWQHYIVPVISAVALAEGAMVAVSVRGVRRRLALVLPGVESMAASAAQVMWRRRRRRGRGRRRGRRRRRRRRSTTASSSSSSTAQPRSSSR